MKYSLTFPSSLPSGKNINYVALPNNILTLRIVWTADHLILTIELLIVLIISAGIKISQRLNLFKSTSMEESFGRRNYLIYTIEREKNVLVVCKVALRTIILRDNIIRKHWWTINNITYMLQLRYNKSNMVI